VPIEQRPKIYLLVIDAVAIGPDLHLGLTETPMTANMLKMTAMREGAARQYPLAGIQSAARVADVSKTKGFADSSDIHDGHRTGIQIGIHSFWSTF